MAGKVIGAYTAAITIDGSNHYLLIQPGTSSAAYNKINRNVFLGVSGQPADISTVQTLSNKILDNTNTITVRDGVFTLQDDVDLTKQARFQLSGITTATTRTYTLPNATGTLADLTTAQTFTNKTITSPAITGGTITNATVTLDAIGEFTVNNGVTIDGLNIMNGALNTNNSVVTANITDAAVTPAKLVAGTGAGWTYQPWTPTWTNLTVGNGTVAGGYIQIGKTVFFRYRLVLGTTSSVSTSAQFTLPVTAGAGQINNQPIGQVNTLDVSASTFYPGQIWANTTTLGQPLWFNAAGTYVVSVGTTSTQPITWATGDELHLFGNYEAA